MSLSTSWLPLLPIDCGSKGSAPTIFLPDKELNHQSNPPRRTTLYTNKNHFSHKLILTTVGSNQDGPLPSDFTAPHVRNDPFHHQISYVTALKANPFVHKHRYASASRLNAYIPPIPMSYKSIIIANQLHQVVRAKKAVKRRMQLEKRTRLKLFHIEDGLKDAFRAYILKQKKNDQENDDTNKNQLDDPEDEGICLDEQEPVIVSLRGGALDRPVRANRGQKMKEAIRNLARSSFSPEGLSSGTESSPERGRKRSNTIPSGRVPKRTKAAMSIRQLPTPEDSAAPSSRSGISSDTERESGSDSEMQKFTIRFIDPDPPSSRSGTRSDSGKESGSDSETQRFTIRFVDPDFVPSRSDTRSDSGKESGSDSETQRFTIRFVDPDFVPSVPVQAEQNINSVIENENPRQDHKEDFHSEAIKTKAQRGHNEPDLHEVVRPSEGSVRLMPQNEKSVQSSSKIVDTVPPKAPSPELGDEQIGPVDLERQLTDQELHMFLVPAYRTRTAKGRKRIGLHFQKRFGWNPGKQKLSMIETYVKRLPQKLRRR